MGPAVLRGKRGRELVKRMPPDRVLTQSDAPFVMFGDRTIQPWDVEDAVKQLAELWSLQVHDVEERLAVNLRTLIGSA